MSVIVRQAFPDKEQFKAGKQIIGYILKIQSGLEIIQVPQHRLMLCECTLSPLCRG